MSNIKIPWTKSGDFDATIGVFFDGFTKILVGVSVMVGVMKMPSDIVFGKIVVAIGFSALLMLAFSTLYARRLGQKTGNANITALPGGISGGTFFVWLNAIILPVYFATGDAMVAWGTAVSASLLYSVIMLASAFLINFILKYIPREALMGALVGGSLTWLVIASLADGYVNPWVIIPTLFVLLTFYFGKIEPKKLSPAFIAIGVGTIIAWATGVMKFDGLKASFDSVGFYIPLPQIGILSGETFKIALTYLPLIIAYVLADVTAVMQSVEQAKQSNEEYNTKTCLFGLVGTNMLGALFGNPFPMNFYWGHPAWKRAGAGASYPLFVGIIYLVLCGTGLVAIATAIIPASATLVMLIYAGITTGAQAFETTDKKYYNAMMFGVAIPVFEIISGKIASAVSAANNAYAAAGAASVEVTKTFLSEAGVARGFEVLSQGAMSTAIIYVSILVYITDRKWINAAAFFVAGAACSFVGLMHSPEVKLNAAPMFTALYLVMAAAFFIIHFISKKNKNETKKVEATN